MLFKTMLCIILPSCYCSTGFSQSLTVDTAQNSTIKKINEKEYNIGNGKTFIYTKPKVFSFLTNLPKDAAGIVVTTFRKKSLKPLLFIAGSTAVLLLTDESVSTGIQQFSQHVGLSSEEKYNDVLNIKLGKTNVSLLKTPRNINTALYQLGQGFPSLLIGAGLFTYGKIHKDYRAISTASQLAETFILMGVGTQVLKRISGRQSPSEATDLDGSWHIFPSFKHYQDHTPNYDAFPSGHLATLMSTVTVLAENYPKKKWIKPIGYTITGLVGFSMINNNVHWASDYPLAIALGYLCAKQIVKNNRRVAQTFATNKKKGTLSYTFNYVNGKFMPGVLYKF